VFFSGKTRENNIVLPSSGRQFICFVFTNSFHSFIHYSLDEQVKSKAATYRYTCMYDPYKKHDAAKNFELFKGVTEVSSYYT